MQGGDLDNRIPPRLCFLFEDTVAKRPPDKRWRRRKKDAALERWLPNQAVTKRMWDIVVRSSYRKDVVTLLGAGMLPALERWVDRYDLPVAHCWALDPEGLSDWLNARVATVRIFYGSPDLALRFGSLGVGIDPEHDFEPF